VDFLEGRVSMGCSFWGRRVKGSASCRTAAARRTVRGGREGSTGGRRALRCAVDLDTLELAAHAGTSARPVSRSWRRRTSRSTRPSCLRTSLPPHARVRRRRSTSTSSPRAAATLVLGHTSGLYRGRCGEPRRTSGPEGLRHALDSVRALPAGRARGLRRTGCRYCRRARSGRCRRGVGPGLRLPGASSRRGP